ncbi:serine-rich adhesin for platelets-like isoform X3 [Takifugu flavidus]|uniref:serine-rich adhesin for platelets-like isoform X3 n=1 Tax=Takifugu flavidus TaxID=433684 RepID=UPI0025449225|nr:serine-rich adhesin for platelets-like isoform X3 [Takifugu flavidus]
METDVEGSDDDAQGQSKHTVLWEKCIHQSIYVDLSENESLNLSDLERSLLLHVSQDESAASVPSIHLTAEHADLSDATSSESSVNSQSDGLVEHKSHMLQPAAQCPKRMLRFDNSGQNTSDEEQEELPYDGGLGSNYSKNVISKISSGRKETVNSSPDSPDCFEPNTGNNATVTESLLPVEQTSDNQATSKTADMRKENVFITAKQSPFPPPRPCPADIHQLLLRHFPQEDLLQTDRLIQAETLPEVSLIESMDDTGCSLVSTHDSDSIDSNQSNSSASDPEVLKEKNSGSEGNGDSKTDVTSYTTDSTTLSLEGSGNSSVVNVSKQEKAKKDQQVPKVPLMRMRSFSDMKYGQGQVHYPLPDFSKISSKVKTHKVPSGPGRPAPQRVAAMHRTRSSPEILEVISRVLEDSDQTSENTHVLSDAARTPPNPAHQLQLSSEVMHNDGTTGDFGGSAPTLVGRHLEPFTPHPLSGGRNLQSNVRVRSSTSCAQPAEVLSDGEQMTAELRDVVCQFMQKVSVKMCQRRNLHTARSICHPSPNQVEEFKRSVSHLSVSTTEQQDMLRSIMEAQDQLERRYISKKEEHRALEMQSYMGVSRNTGTFDPNRHVEGDIFRIGMHLEDIKEIIDRNICEQVSLPCSSSTPTSVKDILDMKPLCMSTPLPLPSLQEASGADYSNLHYQTETWNGEDKISEDVDQNVGHQTSSELVISDPSQRNTRFSSSMSRCLYVTEQEVDIQTAEVDDEVSSALSEALDHSNILEYLSGAKLSSRHSQQTPECCSTLEAVLNVSSDAAICSPSQPPVNTSSLTSQIVRAETDSGFGSLYLNQTGLFQPNLLAGRVQPQNDAPSNSDSEASCSNVQSVQSVATRQGLDSPQQSGVAVGVEQWVENTTKLSSLRLKEETKGKWKPSAPLHDHISDPILRCTVAAVESSSCLCSCSCKSEAIVALQSEVSRLREDLQECLVQLPLIAREVDYLASVRQQRAKTRSRSQHRSTYNRTRHDRNILSSRQMTIADWISVNMDQSKKSVDSTDSDLLQCTEMSIGGRITPEFREGPKPPNLKHKQGVPHTRAKEGPQDFITEKSYSKEHRPAFSSTYHQKPLLQVNYGSSSSLPASYKIREPSELQNTKHHRKRSTQSDTALLPSDVYFQRTPSPASVASKTGSKESRSKRSKEDDIIMSLDMAIELARNMKQTTDKMAKRLSADLSESHPRRTPHNMQPLEGSKHGLL